MQMKPVHSVNFLRGGGEMGALIRDFDWHNSPVGDPQGWPPSLRTIVAMILSSQFPMLLWWGDELIQFYNDAFRPSLGNAGKHPRALGQRAHDCWPETWTTIKPMIDQVLSGGLGSWNENQPFPSYRNGHIETAYWTFSYSAVLAESGQIGGVLVVCQETTQLVMEHQKLQQSEARFRSVFEQAPMGIALLNSREMIIELANGPMYDIWGKDPSVIGMTLLEAQPELEGQRFIELLQAVYDTGEPYFGHGELAWMQRQGKLQEAYFNFTYSPRRDVFGTIIGVKILANEVTTQKEKERVLQQSLKHEQELNQHKSQFVATASHEFRTPLTTIQTCVDLIKLYLVKPQDIANPFIEKYLGVIHQQIQNVDGFLTDLLCIGTIEAGKVAFAPRWVDVEVLCRYVVTSHFSHQSDSRTVQFSLEGMPCRAFLDEKLITHVLVNLLSNAFKFSKSNPQLVIRFGYQELVIEVIDEGIGIPAGDLTALFQTFFRARNTTAIQGTGLGLVIARQFVALHGGTLTVQSEEGHGTTLTIILPVAPKIQTLHS